MQKPAVNAVSLAFIKTLPPRARLFLLNDEQEGEGA
jgi:hypothetical protein